MTDAVGTTAFTYNAADQVATIDDPFVTDLPLLTDTWRLGREDSNIASYEFRRRQLTERGVPTLEVVEDLDPFEGRRAGFGRVANRRRSSSLFSVPKELSATALSVPTAPIDGSSPASRSLRPKAKLVYREP